MKRRGRKKYGVQAVGAGSMAAGGDIINPRTRIEQLHLHQPPPGPGDVEFTVRKLARQVQRQWELEANRRSLARPDPIPVRWRLQPSLSDHPRNVDRAAAGDEESSWEGASSGDVSWLAERFRQTRRRRLVLVGGPGSGKTTLAVQVLLQLLKTRRPGEPVPVLLPASGWDTARFPTLHAWLEDRLPRDYPALRSGEHARAVHALVTGSHVLPVLDGLDELPDEAQAKVIDALNLSLGDGDQLILTSRTREFREAVAATGDVLTSSATLAALPLEPDVVADYLRAGVPRVRAGAWRQVFAELDGDAPWAVLAEVTATPLGVWLLRTVYTAPGADPAELADHGRFPDASALRSLLVDRLAAALVATRPPAGKPYGDDPQEQLLPRRSHDADDVERWLGFLAGFLTEKAKTRDLAWWLLTTAVFNPPGAPFSWGTQNYIPGYYDNYPAPPGWAEANLVTIKLTLPGRVGALCRALAIGLSVALAGGALVAGFIGLLSGGWRVGVAVGTSFAVTFALPLALKDWAEIPVSTADPTTPTTSWRAARTAARFHRWVGVLAGGVTSALAFGVAFGWMPGLLIALPAGALAGRGIGFLTQYEDAWPKYTAVARSLARVHGFPRDLIGFLDDAHRLGLLRIVGPIYQFRHAEYHDHLAGRLLYRDP